jgi:hypothetical protein
MSTLLNREDFLYGEEWPELPKPAEPPVRMPLFGAIRTDDLSDDWLASAMRFKERSEFFPRPPHVHIAEVLGSTRYASHAVTPRLRVLVCLDTAEYFCSSDREMKDAIRAVRDAMLERLVDEERVEYSRRREVEEYVEFRARSGHTLCFCGTDLLQVLGVTQSWLRRAVCAGHIRPVRHGRSILSSIFTGTSVMELCRMLSVPLPAALLPGAEIVDTPRKPNRRTRKPSGRSRQQRRRKGRGQR